MKRDANLKNITRLKYQYYSFFLVLFLLFSNLTVLADNINYENETNIKIDILFEEPHLSKINVNSSIFTCVNLKDCIYLANPGDPILPVYPARILLPYNKKIKNIQIYHDTFEKISYNLIDKPVIPQQAIFPFSKVKNCTTFFKNETKYNSDKPIFDKFFSIGEIGFQRGYRLLTVYLYPIQYMPSRGTIYHTDEFSIEIEFEKNNNFFLSNKNNFLRNNQNDQEFIQNFVENPDTIKTYNNENKIDTSEYNSSFSYGICNPEEKKEYVVITSNSLKDTNRFEYNLSDLIKHREKYDGYDTTIITIEEINSCKSYWNKTAIFNDTQAHIREFCKDAYLNWDTEFILLAGDWDSTDSHQIVPYRLFTDRYFTNRHKGNFYDSMACDMYYSHLDSDWYYSDGIWGGGKNGQNDMYGELFVGRITCYDAETVSNAVYKIINYETNSSYQNNWLRNVSFLGGDLGWTVTSKEYMEEIRTGEDSYRIFTGFEEWNNNNYEIFNTTEGIYHADLGSEYKDYFKRSIENDNFSIINHLGHANIYLPFELIDWGSIYNTKPFFGYSQGCLSGRFHDGESGCERLICKNKNRHAFALVLNTGYGYGSTINTNGPSQYINSFFWDYFLKEQSENQDNWQIGKAMIYAQNKMSSMINSYSSAWCYSWYSANLFGDPALKIKINNTIDGIQINNENPTNHSKNISLNLSNVCVDIRSNENTFNWTIETFPDIGKDSGFDDTSGTKICNISNLTFLTTYYWYVNATDNSDFKNVFYVFTTRNQYIPEPPINFCAVPYNKKQINLTWNKQDKADYTVIEYNTTNQTWEKGEGIEIYDGTKNSFNHTNLLSNTTYYYQAWSFNNTDKTLSINKTSTNATTDKNNPPYFYIPSPENCSTDQLLSINWTIKIKDLDFDPFNYSIECNNKQSISENNSSNGLKYLELTNLSYDTQYKVWVNASDQDDRKNSWYIFTTKSLTINNPPTIKNEIPKNNSVDVSIYTSSLSVLIKDPNSENFNWSIKTIPDIGDIYEVNTNNGSKKCYISSLDYSTTYKWYVSVTDGADYINKTFSFTTEEEPQKENNGDSVTNNDPVLSYNNDPISDAGGPYYGYINEEILFNGSKSFDLDEDILTYSWDFGDGKKDTGEKTVHSYSSEGNYTVILTVSDGSIQKTDVTYAIISKKINNNFSNDEENYSEDILIDQKETDDDNDGISNEDEIKLGTDKNDSSDVTLIIIDSHEYYLLDLDKDGKSDLFYNPKNLINTTIKTYDEDTILIDINGDNKWDYKYNIIDQTYSKYSILAKNENKSFISLNYLIIITIVLSIVFLIGLIKFRKTVNLDDKLTNYIQKNNLSKEGVFYFEENKKKNNSLVTHTKNLDKYKKSKSYQIDEIVDKIFDSKNKK